MQVEYQVFILNKWLIMSGRRHYAVAFFIVGLWQVIYYIKYVSEAGLMQDEVFLGFSGCC